MLGRAKVDVDIEDPSAGGVVERLGNFVEAFEAQEEEYSIGPLDIEDDDDAEYDEEQHAGLPAIGQRLRIWRGVEDGEDPPGCWRHCTIVDMDLEKLLLEVRWASSGLDETIAIDSLDEDTAEVLESDRIEGALHSLQIGRDEDLERLEEGVEGVMTTLDDFVQEEALLRVVSVEVEARADEMRALRAENRKLREEQARFKQRYEEMLEKAESEELNSV